MAMNDHVSRIGAWFLENGHRTLLKVSGGRFPKKVAGMEPVELFVTGRKSGEVRSSMLTTPIHDENRIVLIASYGGNSDHPQWYKNLVANPEIEIEIGGERKQMVARTASADEKAELWPQAVAAYKGYAGYQKQTDRDIPVVICEPR